jgi:hypothetical protein
MDKTCIDETCIDETCANEKKVINVTGTNNKYQIKKLIDSHKEKKKKRVITDNWTFELPTIVNQLQIITDISNNSMAYFDSVSKTVCHEINKKISSYKQQDVIKKRLQSDKFLTFESVIKNLIECKLKCRYCEADMFVLYDITREQKQWSVDRVDNDQGHNIDNYHLACLECNLKRRRRTDEKFLFTKQLKLVKKDVDL